MASRVADHLPSGKRSLAGQLKQAYVEEGQVFIWFGIFEHPVVMPLLLTLGVDGLIVDDPVALRNILGR